MWYVWGTGEVHTGYWWGKLRGRDYLEDIGINRIILKWMFKKRNGERCLDLGGSG